MKCDIEIDLCVELQPEGITQQLYVGAGSCEPCYEQVDSWHEIVERTVEYYIVPGSGIIRPHDVEELTKLVNGMQSAIDLFNKMIEDRSS